MNSKDIKITKQKETQKSWNFLVKIGDTEYSVDVSKDYLHKLTNGTPDPIELVRNSFIFLLAREPKESILKSFNLKQINDYFPEYEKEIASMLI